MTRGSFGDAAFQIKAALSLGLAAGFLLSPRLWFGSRSYPPAPVFDWLPSPPPPLDAAIVAALLLLLAWIAIAARPVRGLGAFLAAASAYALFDQTRWQPWFYQYLAMLAVLYWLYRDPGEERREAALHGCGLIVAGVYFWSGIHKFNPGFANDVLPFLLRPFHVEPPGGWLKPLGIAAAAFETAIGAGLLTARLRRPMAMAAIAMHWFILASIGPFGSGFDRVVWPWNLAMIGFLVVLFRRTPAGKRRRGLWRGEPALVKTAVCIFGVLPALSLADLMDGYPAFSLYSGNNNRATIYMADAVADRLPDRVQESIEMNDSGVDELSLLDWSFAELGVPPYAEARVFRSIARQICSLAGNPVRLALVVRRKSTLLRGPRLAVYDCGSIQSPAARRAPGGRSTGNPSSAVLPDRRRR